MKTLQRIAVLLLLMAFLFGITGLSVRHHICKSSNQTTVTVYPEIFKSSGSSCCEDESTGYSCAAYSNRALDVMPLNIDAAACCINRASFLKLEILSERIQKQALIVDHAPMPVYPVSISTEPTVEQPLLQPAHFQFYSPPLFGKALACYLHQLKIPDHTSIA